MSGETDPVRKHGVKPLVIPPLSLSENLNAQRRKILRAMVIVEDAGLGKESAMVAMRPDGGIDQPRLAAVLAGAATLLREVMKALDSVVAEQKASEGRPA